MESMKRAKIFLLPALIAMLTPSALFSTAQAQAVAKPLVHKGLQHTVERVYNQWRVSMINKNYKLWKSQTAENRQVTIYNRIVSSRQAWPQTIFKIPVAPPSVQGLKAVNVNMKGRTATATYFGKINFGVGGDPSENLMLLHFVGEGEKWKFDKADYINLAGLPDVRKQLAGGNATYVKQKDFMASGTAPKVPTQIKKRGYIAKLYVWCPGREVKVNIHGDLSTHRFQNDKRAEVVIGGAYDGKNKISYSIKSLPGSKGNEPMDIRIFLMSEIPGVKPTVVYKYRVTPEEIKAGVRPKATHTGVFDVTVEHVKAIMTKGDR